MKAIIPVKKTSIRVPNKNFKPFCNNHSLFDITVEKLLKSFDPSDIYMSCDDEKKKELANRWGINFLLRESHLADNDTPFFEIFNEVCGQVPGDDDIAWCAVIDPVFNDYEKCFDVWNKKNLKKSYDSLVVVYPHKDYCLNSSYHPEGFGFGPWHTKSQLLPVKYQLTFTLSILTRESIRKYGYFVGAKPFWYHALNPRVDIDTPQDFELARAVYLYYTNENRKDNFKTPSLF